MSKQNNQPDHLSQVDKALADAVPVYPAAIDGRLPTLDRGQYCYMVSRDGLFAVGRGAGFTGVVPVAGAYTPTPFGQLTPGVFYDRGAVVDADLIKEAAQAANKNYENEWAGVILRDPNTGEHFRRDVAYHYHDRTSVSVDTTSYDTTGEEADLVVDIHSHSTGSPGFSETDNESDSRGIHISLVFGYCGGDWTNIAMAARLCVCGHVFPLEQLPDWVHFKESEDA